MMTMAVCTGSVLTDTIRYDQYPLTWLLSSPSIRFSLHPTSMNTNLLFVKLMFIK
jgi:hypothetical protein